MKFSERHQPASTLSGAILLSHPTLTDPNFNKTIVFLSAHSEDQGTLGVILNRPLGQKLADLDSSFDGKPFGETPVYEGGPVEKEKLIIAAWEWMESPNSFKLYFGIDMQKAEQLRVDNPNVRVACFVGHSGWSPGQLESELKENAWVVSKLDKELFARLEDKQIVWKNVLGSVSDELRFLADAPEDPELN
ncbi:uncharacterized protein METZ01_LOCUS354348 [marine metagenome]|uniref:YqgE/AlgH family protein n=1 Tax=marine metagenome TaxID=408172 RepID=A0A382RUZ5_9ZZZZ